MAATPLVEVGLACLLERGGHRELNRRRRPFHGPLPIDPNRLESAGETDNNARIVPRGRNSPPVATPFWLVDNIIGQV
jgi:hypothetical protein